MQNFVAGICPCCGGKINVIENSDRCFCSYCGTQILTQAAIAFARVRIEGEVQTRAADFEIIGGKLVKYNGQGKDVVIPDGVREIGFRVFQNLYIESVKLPEGLILINSEAFENCKYLTRINFPGSLKNIGYRAFADTGIKNIIIPEGVEVIGGGAFNGCEYLTQIKLPGSLKTISEFAFSGTGIENIIIPEGVTSIYRNAFSNSKLKSITLPNSLETLGATYVESDYDYRVFEGSLLESYRGPERWKPTYENIKYYEGTPLANHIKNQMRSYRISHNLCTYCGSGFKGIVNKVCTRCGRPKDY